jgi:MarR family transcriptional regulator, organic hydroperoxide resistance regulator
MSSTKQALMDRLQFLGQMGSTETALFHQKAAESFGMGITDMKTVSTLMQEGPMTAGQIAARLSLTSGAVTNLVDRLEGHGVVKRTADLNDRRRVIIEVIPSAFEGRNNIYEEVGRDYANLLDGYTEQELEFLVRYHEKQIELTKRHIASLAKK